MSRVVVRSAVPVPLGLVGGAVGVLAGGVAGFKIAEATDCNSWNCALLSSHLGAVVGETLCLSTGVHLGTNGRRYVPTRLAGAAGTAVTLRLTSATERPEVLLAGPVIQLAVTISVARPDR